MRGDPIRHKSEGPVETTVLTDIISKVSIGIELVLEDVVAMRTEDSFRIVMELVVALICLYQIHNIGSIG